MSNQIVIPNPSKPKLAFPAFQSRNYRLYFMGQGLSVLGNWMTSTAAIWLLYQQSESPWLLGVVGFLTQLPSLLLMPFGGVLVDRLNHHRTLLVTQTLSMIQSFALAILTFTGIINIWYIIGLGLFQATINAIDSPTSQAFVPEIVKKPEHMASALALNSTLFNAARLLGPAIAGLVVAAVGAGHCFLIDGLSYLAVLASLLAMRLDPKRQKIANTKIDLASFWQNLKEGFVYSFNFIPIRATLLLLGLLSFLRINYTVILPTFATKILHGDASTLGILTGASGVGALVGAISLTQNKGNRKLGRQIAIGALMVGISMIAFALSRSLWLSAFLLALVNFSTILQTNASNTIIQTLVDNDKRGRVMSLYLLTFLGMMSLGSLFKGGLIDLIGTQQAVAFNGFVCVMGGILFALQLPKIQKIVLNNSLQKINNIPVKTSLPQNPDIVQDSEQHRKLLTYLRHELITPIDVITGFSEVLIDELKFPQDSSWKNNFQKIRTHSLEMLRSVTVVFDAMLLEVDRFHCNIPELSSIIRLELVRPLNSIIGYCEKWLVQAPSALTPDLRSIHVAAQQLSDLLDNIMTMAELQLQFHAIDENRNIASEYLETPTAIGLGQKAITVIPFLDKDVFKSEFSLIGRILVLDDNNTKSELISRQLVPQGHNVAVAHDHQQALQILSTIPYDLILLKVVILNTNHASLLQQLQRHPQWRQISVITILASDDIDLAVKCIELGAEDYLVEPLNPAILRAKVTACLEKKRLRDAKENYYSIFENAVQGIYQSSLDGRFISVNPAMARIYGYSSTSAMLKNVTNIDDQMYVHSRACQEFKRRLEEQGEVTGFEYQAYRQDGTIIWVSQSARAVFDHQQRLLHYEGIVADITQRKLAEGSLLRRVEQLQVENKQNKIQNPKSKI